MDIRWKKWDKMKPGDRHVHESTIKDCGAIRYHKGHYVNRPYLKYSTSKWECSFIDLYDVLFSHLKHADIKLLELGVYTGESIKYFRDYFTNPDAQIVGFDHHPCEFYGHDWLASVKGIPNTPTSGDPYDGATHNVNFFLGDQSSPDQLKECCDQYGPFDIIIDDASHYVNLTDSTFRYVWPFLKEGGIYCVEDIGVNEIKYLLDEVTVMKWGRGVIMRPGGFGPASSGCSSVCLVLVKDSKYSITGLDEILTE